MKKGTIAARNTHFEGNASLRLPKQVQLNRVKRVIREELTELQRQTLTAYYLQGQNIPAIARERGVSKSTVCRTLHRAEDKLRRFLQY